MTDDVIERCTAAGVRCLHKELAGELTVGEARPLITEAILSALRPGDVLPNGCVVVPDNDWAVVAQFSALSPAKKRAVFAFIEVAKEEG